MRYRFTTDFETHQIGSTTECEPDDPRVRAGVLVPVADASANAVASTTAPPAKPKRRRTAKKAAGAKDGSDE